MLSLAVAVGSIAVSVPSQRLASLVAADAERKSDSNSKPPGPSNVALGSKSPATLSVDELARAIDMAQLSKFAYLVPDEEGGVLVPRSDSNFGKPPRMPRKYKDYYAFKTYKVKGTTGALWYNTKLNECVFAFTGTDEPGDWVRSNALSITTVRLTSRTSEDITYDVPAGFAAYYSQLTSFISPLLAYPGEPYPEACARLTGKFPLGVLPHVVTTGHSLGGAAAQLAAMLGDSDESWTFGNPKTLQSNADGDCPRLLPTSYSFYNKIDPLETSSRYFDLGKEFVDFVATIPRLVLEKALEGGNVRGMHCAHKHTELYWKGSVLDDKYGQAAQAATDYYYDQALGWVGRKAGQAAQYVGQIVEGKFNVSVNVSAQEVAQVVQDLTNASAGDFIEAEMDKFNVTFPPPEASYTVYSGGTPNPDPCLPGKLALPEGVGCSEYSLVADGLNATMVLYAHSIDNYIRSLEMNLEAAKQVVAAEQGSGSGEVKEMD
jgi:hypothetical protein